MHSHDDPCPTCGAARATAPGVSEAFDPTGGTAGGVTAGDVTAGDVTAARAAHPAGTGGAGPTHASTPWGRLRGFLLDPTHDQTQRMARLVGPTFVVCAVALVPWAAYLYVVLPGRAESHNYDLAWAGFDVAMVLALLATTWALVRLSRALPIAASALATMLVVDAWFDVLTAPPGAERLVAVAMALLVELPLAAVASWMAYHGQALRERAIVVRLVRASRDGVLTRAFARRVVRRGPRA